MTWNAVLPPNRSAAMTRAALVRPAAYARTRNHISGAVTGLSPYLTHGLVTLREVLAQVLLSEAMTVNYKLVFEFGWREFFRHAWSHEGDGILSSLHAGPLPDSAYASAMPSDIRNACTGMPVIDEAVRSLYASGTLHNHARMWLASYVVHLRRIHWRAGADWMVAHLLDGDLASNHLSWQWVAGTGSHKPYLFNADNVARYAPAQWHSPGSLIDQSYAELDRIARDSCALNPISPSSSGVSVTGGEATLEPLLTALPPPDLQIFAPNPAIIEQLQGREVWLVHPWALRAPPAEVPKDAVIVGVYLREYHTVRPWPEARWRWVDNAMATVAKQRWLVDAEGLSNALAGAARVRSVTDPHITRWLAPLARLDPAPALFPLVEKRCMSFAQWWTRATRNLHDARELL